MRNGVGRRWLRTAAVVLVGSLTLFGCGNDDGDQTATSEAASDTATAAGDPIVVGVPAFISGLFGPQGDAWSHGMQAWADSVNADGGIDGRPVELIIEDTAFDPSKAIPVAQSLMDEDIVSMVGVMDSSFIAGARQLLDREEIPVVGASGASATEYGSPNIFPLGAPVVAMGHLEAEFAYNELEARSAALVCLEAGGLGPHWCDAFTRVFEELGGEVVHRQDVPPTFAEQSSFLVVAKDAGADLFGGFYGDIAPWLQGMESINWTPPAGIVTGSGTYDSMIPLAGSGNPILESTYVPTAGNAYPGPDAEGLDEFREALEASFPGDTPGAYTVIGWLSGKVFEAAVREIGDAELTSEAIIQAVHDLGDFDTGTGVVFDLDGEVPNKGAAIVSVRDGELTEIQPWKADPYFEGLED